MKYIRVKPSCLLNHRHARRVRQFRPRRGPFVLLVSLIELDLILLLGSSAHYGVQASYKQLHSSPDYKSTASMQRSEGASRKIIFTSKAQRTVPETKTLCTHFPSL